jgi:hypothetical protein
MARRKVGSSSDWILPVGLLGIAAFVLYKMGIFSGTATGTGANNAQQNANVTAAAASAYATSAAQVPQSLTDTQLNTLIGNMLNDAEENTAIFSGSSYQQDIITQMGQLVNITDLYRLVQLWGTRNASGASGSICDLIDVDCTAVDFGTFIHATLTSDQISQLNQLLQANGINYTFS